jgi:hypothetical protein
MHLHRVQHVIFILAVIILGVPWPVVAADQAAVPPFLPEGRTRVGDYLAELDRDGRLFASLTTTAGQPAGIDLRSGNAPVESTFQRKSVFKAFALSAIVPGAGQLYTGSKWKAVAFLGLEALSWTGYIMYHKKGDEKTTDFEQFAGDHWSENRYENFLYRNWGVYDDDSAYNDYGHLYFGHHLPTTTTQQYYEMIGKYDQFVFGWDDVDTIATPPIPENLPTAYSERREMYENMRHDANMMFDRASASLIVMMVNHLASGVEAALAARNHNRNVDALTDRVTIRAVTAEIERRSVPMLTITYKF